MTLGSMLGNCKGGKSIEEKGAYFLALLFFILSTPGLFLLRLKTLTISQEVIDEVNAMGGALEPY